MSHTQGRLEAVVFLLENGADGNLQDRFKNTPLNDSVRHKHDAVSTYIRHHFQRKKLRGGLLVLPGCQAAVGFLTAAFEGDLEGVHRFVDNGVTVNGPDYDGYFPYVYMCTYIHICIYIYTCL